MKKFLALALVGLCFLSCEPEGTESSSTGQTTSEPVATESTTEESVKNTEEEVDELNGYLVGNLQRNQIETVNRLTKTNLSESIIQNTQIVLLLENNRILNNLVGVIDETDSLRIMRLTAQSHGFKLVKIK